MKSRNDTFTYLDSDEPGPACLKLLDNLKGIQTGRYEDKFGWNIKVEKSSKDAFRQGAETAEASAGEAEAKSASVDAVNA